MKMGEYTLNFYHVSVYSSVYITMKYICEMHYTFMCNYCRISKLCVYVCVGLFFFFLYIHLKSFFYFHDPLFPQVLCYSWHNSQHTSHDTHTSHTTVQCSCKQTIHTFPPTPRIIPWVYSLTLFKSLIPHTFPPTPPLLLPVSYIREGTCGVVPVALALAPTRAAAADV